jgi:hypothetical protein
VKNKTLSTEQAVCPVCINTWALLDTCTHTHTHHNTHKHRQQLQRRFNSISCCNINPQRSLAPKFLNWLLESKNIYHNLTLHPLISSSGVTWNASFTFHHCRPCCWNRLVGYEPLWLNLYLPPSKIFRMLFNP